MKKIVSGIQPSNNLTLGNFLGAIKYLVESQKNNDLYVFVADLHALSGNFDPKTLYQNKINLVSSYVAAGLNIKKTHIFFQSAVPAHCEIN
jgi:tryptophanyl-tRNA synthetase